MGVSEEVGKVSEVAITAMKSVPLAIALLVVNVAFLAFAAYLLGQVAANAAERNVTQSKLIEKLITDLTNCGRGKSQTGMRSLLYRDSIAPEEIAR